jgi:hypothetical protein
MINKINTFPTSKAVFFILPVILVIGIFVYLHIRSAQLTRGFYRMKINSVVIKRSDWKKSSIDFILNNAVVLTFLAPAEGTLEIGDSIQKVSNTFIYSVYRRNINNEYELIRTYDYNERGY